MSLLELVEDVDPMTRDPRLYLDDIADALHKIITYTEGMNYENFCGDQRTIDAVVRNLEIVGEATKQLASKVKEEWTELPWKEMAGMRDKLIHAYFGVSLQIVWKTVTERVPELHLLLNDLTSEWDSRYGDDQ